MKIYEYRIPLPMTVDEFQIGNLWTNARVSKDNTGGGEGVLILENSHFDNKTDLLPGYTSGTYTHKLYKIQDKIPKWAKRFVSKGKIELHHETWNAYPYIKSYMHTTDQYKDKFFLKIESFYANDKGQLKNPFNMDSEQLKKRKQTTIDFAYDYTKDYKESEDPTKFVSKKTGRGRLQRNWQSTTQPIMCAYKLITVYCKIPGFQRRIEKALLDVNKRIMVTFHRRVFCWMDEWYGLSLADAQNIQLNLKSELAQKIASGQVVGDVCGDQTDLSAEDKEDDHDD